MRRYESYKDSGVEWLGEVPSHWDVQRSKFIFKKIERKVNEEDQIVTCFRDGQVTLRANRRTEGFTNALKEHGYQGIRKGDLVIHAMDAFAGAIGISDSDGKATPVYSVCLPHNKQKIDVYFYAYYLRNLALSGFISSLAKGIRERSTDFRYADFAELLLPIPPYLEQQKIAQFLDDKTAKIDQAVALAENQIALLKEHKQILIQNTVTRGLNPDVPLKDSGVEWIGQVPEHWDVKKLKFVSKINQHTLPENTNGSLIIKYVDIGSVSFENGIEKVENFSFKNAPSRARRLANKGDIVVSTVRTYLKAITMVKEEYQDCIFSTGFAVVTSNECLKDSFFELYAKSDAFTEQVSVSSKGMSYPAINSTDLSNLWITVPPLSEQQKIADYLDTQTAKIDQAIALKTAHIEKLKEYKNVLINDVVTGKVRV